MIASEGIKITGIKYACVFCLILVLFSCAEQNSVQGKHPPFRIASFHPPEDLHPFSGFATLPMHLIYRHLVWMDSILSRKPDLIESYIVSDDKRKCIISLKRNIYFQDGSLLTTEDVIYSLRYVKQKRIIDLSITNNYPDMQFRTLDKYTLELKSRQPQEWSLLLAIPIISKGYEEKYISNPKLKYIPMGSGAYRFVEYDPIKMIMKLELNNSASNTVAEYDSLEVHYFNDPEAATMALLENKVDYVMGLSLEDAEYAKTHPGIDVFNVNIPYVYQIILNTQSAQLNNIKVRNALSLLIDRNKIVRSSYSLNKIGIPSDSPLHASLPLTTPSAKPPNSAKAVKLLEEAGWVRKNGYLEHGGKRFILEIILPRHNERFLHVLREIVSIWEDVGIVCIIRSVEFQELMDSMNSGKFQASFFEMPDIQELVSNYIFWETDAGKNYSKISDGTIDRLFREIKSSRKHNILNHKKKLQNVIFEKTPAITLFYVVDYGAIRKNYHLNELILKDPYALYYLANAR
jgi:peptide/nickel transport system substrate-binding protein